MEAVQQSSLADPTPLQLAQFESHIRTRSWKSWVRGNEMDKADIPFLSVTQLSEFIKDRTISPVEAVESYLERIDNLNGRPVSYTHLTLPTNREV